MNSELFQPTLPLGEPELMRASAYQRYLDELRTASGGISTRISQLSPSLKADLLRFGDDGGASEVVEVMAACVRHGKRVTIHIQTGERVVPLTVFAQERLVHCPMAPDELVGKPMLDLKVMHVEPACCNRRARRMRPWSAPNNRTTRSRRCCGSWRCAACAATAARDHRPGGLPRGAGAEIDFALPATGALTPAIQRLAPGRDAEGTGRLAGHGPRARHAAAQRAVPAERADRQPLAPRRGARRLVLNRALSETQLLPALQRAHQPVRRSRPRACAPRSCAAHPSRSPTGRRAAR